jgi:hypothetical protein
MSIFQPTPGVLLMDNGSLEPAAILRLRVLADELGARLNRPVQPVSLQHSDRVPAGQLGGRAAETLEAALRRRLAGGENDFVILPLFIGPTRALSEFLPEVEQRLKTEFPALKLRVAPSLYSESDDRLVQILAEQVTATMAQCGETVVSIRVAVVDHGSPVRAVTEVRNRLAVQLAHRLGDRVAAVAPCSMERRPGADYDFNEPLLAHLLTTPHWNTGVVVVAHLFLLPGRHAGADGDVARICHEAERTAGGRLRTVRAGLLADHPLLLDILHDRARWVGL